MTDRLWGALIAIVGVTSEFFTTNQMHSRQAALLSALLEQQQRLADLSAARRKAARLVRILLLPPDPGIAGAGTTFGHWATLLLTQLGSPTCQDNLTVIVTWEVAEGTAAAFNPLATTHDFPGVTDFNSVGVKNYPTLSAGLQATIETLRLGETSHGYDAILSGLASCAPAQATASLGHVSGRTVVAASSFTDPTDLSTLRPRPVCKAVSASRKTRT